MILGNVLNCITFNPAIGQAGGYLAPPCRSMTKLYNFNAIESWAGPCPERLHGGDGIRVGYEGGFDPPLEREFRGFPGSEAHAAEDSVAQPFPPGLRPCTPWFLRSSSQESWAQIKRIEEVNG